ncbi:ABC-type dipeptide/oligopeptide/nickel transport system permease component [Bradyrhizobium sp. GM6.1]
MSGSFNAQEEVAMLTMIGKRLMFAIPSLIGVVIVTFLLTRALPGDPAAYFAGPPPQRKKPSSRSGKNSASTSR